MEQDYSSNDVVTELNHPQQQDRNVAMLSNSSSSKGSLSRTIESSTTKTTANPSSLLIGSVSRMTETTSTPNSHSSLLLDQSKVIHEEEEHDDENDYYSGNHNTSTISLDSAAATQAISQSFLESEQQGNTTTLLLNNNSNTRISPQQQKQQQQSTMLYSSSTNHPLRERSFTSPDSTFNYHYNARSGYNNTSTSFEFSQHHHQHDDDDDIESSESDFFLQSPAISIHHNSKVTNTTSTIPTSTTIRQDEIHLQQNSQLITYPQTIQEEEDILPSPPQTPTTTSATTTPSPQHPPLSLRNNRQRAYSEPDRRDRFWGRFIRSTTASRHSGSDLFAYGPEDDYWFDESDRRRNLGFESYGGGISSSSSSRRRRRRDNRYSPNRSSSDFVLESNDNTSNSSHDVHRNNSASITPLETIEGQRIMTENVGTNTDITNNPNTTGNENTSSSSMGMMIDNNDPHRTARRNWILINRRFQLIVMVVALLFSLLLFSTLVCWVVLTSAYVVCIDKDCDVPLKMYFWLATFQLVLDVFRGDIMKFILKWDSNASQTIPVRVVLYNIAYLMYAMIVLCLGIQSVFLDNDSKCSETASELFRTSIVYVSLSIAAWSVIILGYFIPFCCVAMLLTRNGYSPAVDVTGNRSFGSVFPSTFSSQGAPPETIHRMRVVSLEEFNDEYPKECCICMGEFDTGEIIVATACQHIFHKRCCKEWLKQARTCPVCRNDIPIGLNMDNSVDHDENEQQVRSGISSSTLQFPGGHLRSSEIQEELGLIFNSMRQRSN